MIDLRSDTVTKPTEDMRRAMAAAEVGDDVYGEDPTVRRLEERIADLLGQEDAVWTPTGSMANQLALRLLVAPGQELLCDEQAHVVRAELGAAAVFSGITTRTWRSVRGELVADDALRLAAPAAGPHLVSTAAVAAEDTHNFAGGTVQPLEQLHALAAGAHALGLGAHLDGARLWNAVVASGVAARERAAGYDTVSVAMSKGLGAPAGSVLASSAARVTEARIWRKRYGGGMRQVGVLAAAGLFALDHHLDRLAEDHEHARRLADAVARVAPEVVEPARVETNIVVLDLSSRVEVAPGEPTSALAPAPALAQRLADAGVLISVLGPTTARLVTHLGVSADDTARAGTALAQALAA
ncbi:MAG: threonine aldolase family protein [Actinomycetales bacterium]